MLDMHHVALAMCAKATTDGYRWLLIDCGYQGKTRTETQRNTPTNTCNDEHEHSFGKPLKCMLYARGSQSDQPTNLAKTYHLQHTSFHHTPFASNTKLPHTILPTPGMSPCDLLVNDTQGVYRLTTLKYLTCKNHEHGDFAVAPQRGNSPKSAPRATEKYYLNTCVLRNAASFLNITSCEYRSEPLVNITNIPTQPHTLALTFTRNQHT